jgi:dTDP-4-dehydrorhamnose 3,5-epimerase
MFKEKPYRLEGLVVRTLEKHNDKRGFFVEVLRDDWKALIQGEDIVQASLSLSNPGIIRAWHRHMRGQVDYIIVVEGTVKIAVYDGQRESPTFGEIVDMQVTGEELKVVRVPGHYWHGTKNIGDKPSLTLYLFTRLYDYKNPDEERREWDDPAIIDPRTSNPYDWNNLP